MAEFVEPKIVINGRELNTAQAMTVRVALGSLAMDLQRKNSLGKDAIGIDIAAGYLRCVGEISRIMQSTCEG